VTSDATADLFAAWGAGPADVWAVGADGVVVHWDGRAWRGVFSDYSRRLIAIGGTRGDDVWAVSDNWDGIPTMIHWNGTEWTVAERSTRIGLYGVRGVGPDELWAVGGGDTLLHHRP